MIYFKIPKKVKIDLPQCTWGCACKFHNPSVSLYPLSLTPSPCPTCLLTLYTFSPLSFEYYVCGHMYLVCVYVCFVCVSG